MPYNDNGDWFDELEEIDKVFRLLGDDQGIDEDNLRDSPKISRLVKDFVLDTGATWDDLVNACDEKFGTLENRIKEEEAAKRFFERVTERLRDEA